MWKHKYGEFQNKQVEDAKRFIRKQIYFLILCVDPDTKDEYINVDVVAAFDGILRKISGLNSILFYPPELVRVISLLEAALIEYKTSQFDSVEDFKCSTYRKLVLDAGNEVLKIGEVK